MSTLTDKLSTLWKGPGWQPGLPRLGSNKFPRVRLPITVYNPTISTALSIYAFAHFLYTVAQYSAVLRESKVTIERASIILKTNVKSIFKICSELFNNGSFVLHYNFTIHFNNIRSNFR